MPFHGTTFNGAFRKFVEGDLIYGLAGANPMDGPRCKLLKQFFKCANIDFVKILSYLPFIDSFGDLPITQYVPPTENPFEITQENIVNKGMKQDSFHHFRLKTNQFYFYSQQEFEYLSQKYSDYDQGINEYLWRKKSKGGIEWGIHFTPSHIHFCLLGIEMQKVTEKNHCRDFPQEHLGKGKTVKQRSITGSELRWIFRHREDPIVQDRIQFWDSNDNGTTFFACEPPWCNPNYSLLWKEYDKHRLGSGLVN